MCNVSLLKCVSQSKIAKKSKENTFGKLVDLDR